MELDELDALEDATETAPPVLWREHDDPHGYTDARGLHWDVGRIEGRLIRRRSRHLTFTVGIRWSDIEPVITAHPLLLRDVAGLQKRIAEQGSMTLAQLLQWQRDKFDMRV